MPQARPDERTLASEAAWGTRPPILAGGLSLREPAARRQKALSASRLRSRKLCGCGNPVAQVGNGTESAVVIGAGRSHEAVAVGYIVAPSAIRRPMIGVIALDARQAAGHQLGHDPVAVQLTGMGQHRPPAVLHDGCHRIAGVHVGDIAGADAVAFEQLPVEPLVLGAAVGGRRSEPP